MKVNDPEIDTAQTRKPSTGFFYSHKIIYNKVYALLYLYAKVKLKSDELELLFLEITPRNAKGMFLLSWYRPSTPDTEKISFDSLREILRQLERGDKV